MDEIFAEQGLKLPTIIPRSSHLVSEQPIAESKKVGLCLSHICVLEHDVVFFDKGVRAVGATLRADHRDGPLKLIADYLVVIPEQQETPFVRQRS